MQCQLNMQSSDYVHQETQNWVITGPPTQQGAMQVYPAMWSTSGQGSIQRAQGTQIIAGQWATNVQGMNAPLNIFVRASDQRLLISQYHAQAVGPSGVNGVKQSGGTRSNISSAAYEWRFPAIEAGVDDTVVSGSGAAPGLRRPTAAAIPSGNRQRDLPLAIQPGWRGNAVHARYNFKFRCWPPGSGRNDATAGEPAVHTFRRNQRQSKSTHQCDDESGFQQRSSEQQFR